MPPNAPLAYLGGAAGGAGAGAGAGAPPIPRPPAGGGQAPNPAMALGAMEGNRSMLNPTDAAVTASRFGGVTEQTPLIELLPKMGLDPNAPGLPQLRRMAQGQIQGIDTLGKMPAIARGQNATGTPPQAAPGAPPPGVSPAGPAGPAPAPTGGGGSVGSLNDLTRLLGGG